jgi:putative membrane protein
VAPQPVDLWLRWNFDPLVLLPLAALALYPWVSGFKRHRMAVTAAAGVLLLVFVSPLCASASALFSARSVHHLLLAACAAPLLAVALRNNFRIGAGAALLAHAAAFWVWHFPPVYAMALASDAVYWAMQLLLLGTGVAFWSSVWRPGTSPAAAIGGLAGNMMQMGLLGALLTFAPKAFYGPHFFVTQPWGLTPLEDQQLAGLIMWVASIPIFLVPLLALGRRRLDMQAAF